MSLFLQYLTSPELQEFNKQQMDAIKVDPYKLYRLIKRDIDRDVLITKTTFVNSYLEECKDINGIFVHASDYTFCIEAILSHYKQTGLTRLASKFFPKVMHGLKLSSIVKGWDIPAELVRQEVKEKLTVHRKLLWMKVTLIYKNYEGLFYDYQLY